MMDTLEQRTDDGLVYRDLNKNGQLDPYEDPRLPVEERVADLLGRMTLEEKAGLLFQTMVPLESEEGAGPPSLPTAAELIATRQMNHFNVLGSANPGAMAAWYNRVQEAAAATRLGIPVTLSTDPRHSFSANPGASMHAGGRLLAVAGAAWSGRHRRPRPRAGVR